MAKRTLLDLTQSILSAIDGDEVNSISDTIEAGQVAKIIRQEYWNIIDELDMPSDNDLITLEAQGDSDNPTAFRIPENVEKVTWIKYDSRLDAGDNAQYKDIFYREPYDFVTFVNQRPSTDTDLYQVVQYTADIPLVIRKNSAPQYWTSFDDEYIYLDSYNEDLESSLQQSKLIAFGEARPAFTIADDFVPDLPENLFTLLYNKAETTCFSYLKQEINQKSEQSASRSRIRSQRNKWREEQPEHYRPDYGRKPSRRPRFKRGN